MATYLRKRELAERLRLHPASIMRLVKRGALPKPIKLTPGGPCLFAWEKIETALEARLDGIEARSEQTTRVRPSKELPDAGPTAPSTAESLGGKKKRKRRPPAKGGAPAPRAG